MTYPVLRHSFLFIFVFVAVSTQTLSNIGYAIEIRSLAEIEPLLARVRKTADLAVGRLRDLTEGFEDGLAVLRRIKFGEFGRHPVDDRDINLIEQINQTFTYVVSLHAVRFLLDRYVSLPHPISRTGVRFSSKR